MPSLPSLPPDVLLHIFELGMEVEVGRPPSSETRHGLLRVMRVSKAFNLLAEGLLWRDVGLRTPRVVREWLASSAQGKRVPRSITLGIGEDDPQNWPRAIYESTFCERCRGVYKLRFLGPESISPAILAHDALSGWSSLHLRALALLTSPRVLELKELHFEAETFALSASYQRSPFRLTSITCSTRSLWGYLYAPNLASILESLLAGSASSLRRITVTTYGMHRDLGLKDFWPQLPLIATTLEQLQTHNHNFQEIVDYLVPLLPSFTHLSTLSIWIEEKWVPTQPDLTKVFAQFPPSLRNLEIFGPTDPQHLLASHVLGCLSLPSLRGLKLLHFEHYHPVGWQTPKDRGSVGAHDAVREECLKRGVAFSDDRRERFHLLSFQ